MFEQRKPTNSAARQVLQILNEGGYTTASGAWVPLRDEQAAAEAGTRLYSPDDLAKLRGRTGAGGNAPRIEVIDATTQAAARQIFQEGPLVLLNFASARNPGGGFLGGAKAQEEELCRSSGLYRTLLTQPTYYEVNRAQRSLLYTDYLIYSPRVPFFRLDAKSPLLDALYLSSVITAPAPNAGAMHRQDPQEAPQLEETFARRWANVLAAAEHNGHRVVVLGAWGCGAFRNDPRLAAETARAAIFSPRFGGAFDRVIFAIPGSGKANFAAFREVFA